MGRHERQRMGARTRLTAWAGLAALGVHLAAFILSAAMPVALAFAKAEAGPHEIVICTADGPVTLDARTLGHEGHGDHTGHTDQQQIACDLALHAAATAAIDTFPAALPVPTDYAVAEILRPQAASSLRGHDLPATARPRAPPLSS